MSSNFYDVVVIGTELGPLAAGALLAKRGFRVLVLGQKTFPEQYKCFEFTFVKRPFVLSSAGSPVIRRIQNELSINQIFVQAMYTPRPVYQVILHRARPNIYAEANLTKAEIRRELKENELAIQEIFENLGRVNGEIDKLFSNDLVLPPETFMEKRELARSEVQNPFRTGTIKEIIDESQVSSKLIDFLDAPVRFETAGANPVPVLSRFRLMGGFLCDSRAVRNGRDGFVEVLLDLVGSCGGDRIMGACVGEILIKKGRVTGIKISGREETIGCHTILTDFAPLELATLISPTAWTKRFKGITEKEQETPYGYSINLGVAKEVIPAGLAETAFACFGSGLMDELIRIQQIPQKAEGIAALNVSCIVPPGDKDSIYSGELRDALLDRMRSLVPFLDNYLRAIHSPYDGFGAIDLSGLAKGAAPSAPHPEEIPVMRLSQPSGKGALGPENLHYRSGIKGLLFCGNRVISGFGVEGELLAAWGAAHIVCKSNRRAESLFRSMRSKVEM